MLIEKSFQRKDAKDAKIAKKAYRKKRIFLCVLGVFAPWR